MSDEDLERVLLEMDIPDMRRDLSRASNLGWLLRNIRVRNGNHPRVVEVLDKLKELIRVCNLD